jgi:hypothetical protein
MDSVLIKLLQEDAVSLEKRYKELAAAKDQIEKEILRVQTQYDYISTISNRLTQWTAAQKTEAGTQQQVVQQKPTTSEVLPKPQAVVSDPTAVSRMAELATKTEQNLEAGISDQEIQVAKDKANELLKKHNTELTKREEDDTKQKQVNKEKSEKKAKKLQEKAESPVMESELVVKLEPETEIVEVPAEVILKLLRNQ